MGIRAKRNGKFDEDKFWVMFEINIHTIFKDWREVSVFGVFLVRIFPHLVWIQRFTKYISVFNSNERKCGPQKLQIWALFTQWGGGVEENK